MRPTCPWFVAALLLVACLPMLQAAPPTPPAPGAEEEKALKEVKVGADAKSLLEYFKKRTLSEEDHEKIEGLIRQFGDDSFKVRHKATTDLLAIGVPALPFVRRALANPDEEVKERVRDCIATLEKDAKPSVSNSAARLLRLRGTAEAVPILLAYLPDADNEAVEDEVCLALAVLGVRDGKVDAALEAALKEKQAVRRASAALVLGRSGTQEQRTTVQGLLTDPDVRVRFRAAQGLLASRERAGVPVLTALLAEGPPEFAVAAEDLLISLAGARAPRAYFADEPAARKRCRDAWAAWWKTNSKMDLARADVDLLPFNATLRTRAAARQFMTIATQGDMATLKKLTDAPFRLVQQQTIATREELDRMIDQNPLAQRGLQGLPFSILGTTTLDEYAKSMNQNLQPDDKQFFAKLRKNDVRVVYVRFQNPGMMMGGMMMMPRMRGMPDMDFGVDNMALLIRVTGEQPVVVGLGQMNMMIANW
jgi:HEAT repeat protein